MTKPRTLKESFQYIKTNMKWKNRQIIVSLFNMSLTAFMFFALGLSLLISGAHYNNVVIDMDPALCQVLNKTILMIKYDCNAPALCRCYRTYFMVHIYPQNWEGPFNTTYALTTFNTMLYGTDMHEHCFESKLEAQLDFVTWNKNDRVSCYYNKDDIKWGTPAGDFLSSKVAYFQYSPDALFQYKTGYQAMIGCGLALLLVPFVIFPLGLFFWLLAQAKGFEKEKVDAEESEKMVGVEETRGDDKRETDEDESGKDHASGADEALAETHQQPATVDADAAAAEAAEKPKPEEYS
eukprot:TRINITY_DN7794_c1_g1_i1.p1 TRINITY_DN7794_c1_g1~~TRINITY_DN7794_c1_g1_i1.p1  ORF type:complete len:294 (-),score=111.37 TRINITY_DN7794_c1_g1_i1:31-912(-)